MQFVRSLGLCALLACLISPAQSVEIKGAGSTSAQPLYTALVEAYSKKEAFTMSYDPSGSTDGFRRVRGNTVDFGATDVALLEKLRLSSKVMCFPTAISGVVPVVNVPGVKKGQMQMTGEVLADIFSRKITKWNDPKIKSLNPKLDLPDLAITPFVRQEGSGSTFNFSDFLSKSSAEWKTAYGRSFRIKWAQGVVSVKGSGGVVAEVKKTSGAIAYLDYQYVAQNNLASTMLKNRAGKFVSPGRASFSSALNNSSWAATGNYEEMLSDKPGSMSWPITTSTFILIPQVTNNPEKTLAAIKFFTWGFIHGDSIVGKAECACRTTCRAACSGS
jgi:phosphate transport system substrate-binding protein